MLQEPTFTFHGRKDGRVRQTGELRSPDGKRGSILETNTLWTKIIVKFKRGGILSPLNLRTKITGSWQRHKEEGEKGDFGT